MSFFSELKRRNVVRVAVAYAVVGWLLIEVSSVLLPAFEAPGWVLRVIVLLIGIGFVLSAVLSWAYELTPEGVKKTESIPVSESISKVTGRKLDFVLIGVLVVAVAFFLVERSIVDTSGPFAGAEIDPASLAPLSDDLPAVAEEQRQDVLPNSVAVLPLENLSPDPDNAYFAAGMHEEILNHLAKLRNLNVISRTSVVRYIESNLSIPEIAAELNVGAVMEGSVRYANDRVLVTMQLIDPATDAHLWSESYNRDLSDVFAIQADIAMNVANALQAEFSLAEQESIQRQPTDSPAAYALYLRAIADRGSDSTIEEAVNYLDRAIALDPNFALAYGEKALRLSQRGRLDPLLEPERAQSAREAAERALALDANSASAYAALAALGAASGRWAEAEQAYETAYRLSPNDTGVLISYGSFRRDAGQFDEAIRLLQRAADLDPNANRAQLGIAYRYAHDYDLAAAAFRFNIDLDPADSGAHGQLAFNEIARGDHDEGLKQLQIAEELGLAVDNPQRISQLAYAYSQLERQADVERLFNQFLEIEDARPIENAQWALMYFALGDYGRAAERLQAVINNPIGASGLGHIMANQYSDPVLDETPFKELRDQIFALP